MIDSCLVGVNHGGRRGSGECQQCAALLTAVLGSSTNPVERVQGFVAQAVAAYATMGRRPYWLHKSAQAQSVREHQFSLDAVDIAAVEAFRYQYAPARGFPSLASYLKFRAEVLGLTMPSRVDYFETMAVLAGYPGPYRLKADQETISMLEAHREDLATQIPEYMQHFGTRHTKVSDYNQSRRISQGQLREVDAWIRNHGELPSLVTTYRQETAAWGSGAESTEWANHTTGLMPGDMFSWNDRPVSTSLDPGFTRTNTSGWGDAEEWTPQTRSIYFHITASRGFYIGAATAMPFDEHELVLAPTQSYRVTGIRQHATEIMRNKGYGGKGQRMFIYLEEIPDQGDQQTAITAHGHGFMAHKS